MTGIDRIAAERKRQIEKEGWTPRHDDAHVNGELAAAGACYALVPGEEPAGTDLPDEWPEGWDEQWWKPSPNNRIRELEKAGALIAAEIDRLLRIKKTYDAFRAHAYNGQTS